MLILLSPSILFGQQREYKSKEQEQYFKNLRSKTVNPISKNGNMNFPSSVFEFSELANYSTYSDSLYLTPYQDSLYPNWFNPNNPDSIIIPKFE